MIAINTILQHICSPPDEFIYGTANLGGLIDNKFYKYRFGISVGKRLEDLIVDAIVDGPTMDYFHHYHQINKELAEKAKEIKNELQKEGVDSMIIAPTISLGSKDYEKYLSNLTYDLSHKMVATRAGLGWIGKTALFISKEFGPRVRLVSLLMDRKPDLDSIPINESRCGKCTICVERCPAQAATGQLWDIHTHRDTFFDAQKCREKCGELARQKLHVEERICGLCVSVCPIGKKNNR